MLVAFAFMCLGEFAALPRATHENFKGFWTTVAALLGVFLAEQFIYRYYSKKIIP
jgi:hypothetical protein